MNLLAIDTSTKNLSLAVSRDEKILRFRNVKLHQPLSSSIMPRIKEILDKTGISLRQLDGFAVGLGPGSFTSLRVGLATIKGLAFAMHKMVVGISSLDVLAMNVPGDCAQICTLCDAKRNLVYACFYEKKGMTLKKKSKYLLTSIQQVVSEIQGEVIFVGDGIQLFKNSIKSIKGIRPIFLDQNHMLPQARCLVPLALPRFQKKKWDDINKLIPLYLYPDNCQVQTKKKKM